MTNLVNGKTVQMDLVGLDGNAFSLMGAFSKNARKQGWTKDEIDKVMTECMAGDYNHLLSTLVIHTVDTEEVPEEDD